MGFNPDEVSDILDACVALPHEARRAELDRRCGERTSLRLEIESLLGYLPDPEFEGDGTPEGETARAERRVGLVIGGCRLLELIAIGGMGAVYRAEQESPRREVALKVLRAEGAGVDGWRRLKREAIALGRLDHAAIARVFTAGIHRGADGPTPFLTMELVTGGRPITEWWRSTPLPFAARLERFATLCEAVHHGHIKGVLHRDVKPTNLLVDRDDRPKVIDFGIARLLEPATHDGTGPATAGRVLGTIAYMGPERLEGGGEIDARSDVYSLGVVLHELLTGRPSFGGPGASIAATAAAIARGGIPPPSTVDRRCRGDLDAIVAKATALDPAERYDSASALADDLRSHLSDQPIRARGVGRITRVRKFLARNRLAATAIVAVFIALAVGLVSSLRATARAERALYLSLLSQGNLTMARNDVGTALRVLAALGPERQDEWPVRMIRRFTDETIDSAGFGEWNLFRGRLDADRGRMLASGWGERPELIVVGTSPARVAGRIPLPGVGMGCDWGIPQTDGTETVIAGLADGRVIEVRATDGMVLRELARVAPGATDPSTGPISDVALEPGGRRLAIGHSSDAVRLVDLVDGSIRDLGGFADPAAPNWVFVEWSPSGGSLAVAATGGSFTVDAHDGTVRRLSSRSSNQAVFSPDGTRVATALSAGGCELIDLATGAVKVAAEPLWPSWGIDWSPDGRWCTLVGRSHWVVCVEVESSSRRNFKTNSNPAWSVRWISDGEFLTLPTGNVLSMDAPSRRMASVRRNIGDPDRWESRLRFIEGGRALVCVGPDGRIDRVDPLLETRVEIARVPVDKPSADATPDAGTIAVAEGSEPGPLWIVRPHEGSIRRIDGRFLGPVAISPDGRRVAAVGPNGEATLVDVESGRIEHRQARATSARTVSFAWIDDDTVAWCLPKGSTFLDRMDDGAWSVRGDPTHSLLEAWPRGHGEWYWTDLSQRVLRSGADRLGDQDTPESLRGIGLVHCMAGHPTLPIVALGLSDGQVAILDETERAIVANLSVAVRRVTDLAWSPDGTMLAAIDVAGGILIFDSELLSTRWPEIKRRREANAHAAAGSSPDPP